MSYHAILDGLIKVSHIYFKSDKKQKGWLLGHASQITEFHRKALIQEDCPSSPSSCYPKESLSI